MERAVNGSDEALKRAQESFKKQRGKAPPAYEADARAVREKTARLKALRLAKTAEKKQEVPVKPRKPR
jgi:hypothetical protein